jgi:hypothetical protein
VAWDGIDQDCDGEDERDTDCIADGVDDAMLDVMDTEWPVDDYVDDGSLYDLYITDQVLLFDVLGTAITFVEEGTYFAYVPVDVSVNTPEDPFDVEAVGWGLIPDTTCTGWVEPTEIDIEATIDVSVAEDGTLIVEIASYEGTWYGVDEADVELDGCYIDTLDSVYGFFGGDMTGFYDDILLDEITGHIESSVMLIDYFVELECTP